MKKRKIISTILELLVAIVVFISMRSYVAKSTEPVTVYQYTKSYDAGEILAEDSIKAVEMPKAGFNEAFLTKKEDAVGKKAVTKLVQGSFVYTEQLTDANEVDPFEDMDWSKYRLVDVPLLGKLNKDVKGSKVDLVYIGETAKPKDSEGDEGKSAYAKTFMQDVLVVTSTYDEMTDEEKKDNPDGVDNSTMVLAVTLDQAEELFARNATGQIKAVVRHKGAKNYETLGYIVGDFEKKYTGFGSAETGKSIPAEDSFKENK